MAILDFFGFQALTLVWLWISTPNFSCTMLMYMSKSLLIFSDVNFKMAAWRPYWIFWFPDSNFSSALNINSKLQWHSTVDSRYLALVGSQNSRARVKWFSGYLTLSREGADSRIQDHRLTLPGVYNSQTVCWAIIEELTFPGSLHTSTSHQRQITTSNIRF